MKDVYCMRFFCTVYLARILSQGLSSSPPCSVADPGACLSFRMASREESVMFRIHVWSWEAKSRHMHVLYSDRNGFQGLSTLVALSISSCRLQLLPVSRPISPLHLTSEPPSQQKVKEIKRTLSDAGISLTKCCPMNGIFYPQLAFHPPPPVHINIPA